MFDAIADFINEIQQDIDYLKARKSERSQLAREKGLPDKPTVYRGRGDKILDYVFLILMAFGLLVAGSIVLLKGCSLI